MNRLSTFVCALALCVPCAPALASQADQHQSHHPEAATPAQGARAKPAAPAAVPEAAQPDAGMAMEERMAAMRAMHEKMMAARTPAERKALMAEHEKLMRDGMGMASAMSAKGHGGMGCDMGEHHRLMAQHMEMMQLMMQMMLDRLPPDGIGK